MARAGRRARACRKSANNRSASARSWRLIAASPGGVASAASPALARDFDFTTVPGYRLSRTRQTRTGATDRVGADSCSAFLSEPLVPSLACFPALTNVVSHTDSNLVCPSPPRAARQASLTIRLTVLRRTAEGTRRLATLITMLGATDGSLAGVPEPCLTPPGLLLATALGANRSVKSK